MIDPIKEKSAPAILKPSAKKDLVLAPTVLIRKEPEVIKAEKDQVYFFAYDSLMNMVQMHICGIKPLKTLKAEIDKLKRSRPGTNRPGPSTRPTERRSVKDSLKKLKETGACEEQDDNDWGDLYTASMVYTQDTQVNQ